MAGLRRRIEEYLSLRARGASVDAAIELAPLTYTEYEQAVVEGVIKEKEQT